MTRPDGVRVSPLLCAVRQPRSPAPRRVHFPLHLQLTARGKVVITIIAPHVVVVAGGSFWIILFARVVSGVATSLLFSSFESWMVAEHKKRKFDQSLLGHTFAWCSLTNSTSAIVAGLLADGVASQFGPVGPLMATLPFLLVAFVVPFTSWGENYGDATISLKTTLAQGMVAIASSKRVFLLGLIQTLFEGSMHVFVFMWTPTLQGL